MSQGDFVNRLTRYGVAAMAGAVALGGAPQSEAALVFLDLSGAPLTASSPVTSQFVDILGFATGAASFSIATSVGFRYDNPLAPGSELVLFASFSEGSVAGLRGNNGAQIGFVGGGGSYVVNVGTVGNTATSLNGTMGHYLFYSGYGGGQFALDAPGVAFFQFTNTQTGMTHNGWLDVVVDSGGSVSITGITVDTGNSGGVPEPSSMALLCMGAAGVASYRRRRREPAED